LINMLDYAAWSGDGAAEATVRGLVEAHFLHHGGGCDDALETGHFMAGATNWGWLVSKGLPPQEGQRWGGGGFFRAGLAGAAGARRAAGQLAPPRAQLQSCLGAVGALCREPVGGRQGGLPQGLRRPLPRHLRHARPLARQLPRRRPLGTAIRHAGAAAAVWD